MTTTPAHLENRGEARTLLATWAKRTWFGPLPHCGDGTADPKGYENPSLLVCDHVEGFWLSSRARMILRGYCLRQWAQFGVPDLSLAAVLDDMGASEQMARDFAAWLELNPMPRVWHIPVDDVEGDMTNEVQVARREIGTREVAMMLEVSEQHVRREMACGRLLAVMRCGVWVVRISDVWAYERRQKGGARNGAGRKAG